MKNGREFGFRISEFGEMQSRALQLNLQLSATGGATPPLRVSLIPSIAAESPPNSYLLPLHYYLLLQSRGAVTAPVFKHV